MMLDIDEHVQAAQRLVRRRAAESHLLKTYAMESQPDTHRTPPPLLNQLVDQLIRIIGTVYGHFQANRKGRRKMAISRRSVVGGIILSPAVSMLGGTNISHSAESAGQWRSYHDYLSERTAAGEFSGTVLVADGDRGGRPVLAQGYGMADRGRGIANTVQTRFCIASMGKMFTAVAVAQLVQRGRLTFHDTIGRYVPGFPPEIADRVTIHHLLTHTSGMGDVLFPPSGEEPPHTLAGLMEIIVGKPLLFEPGAQFGYSNSGFIVLGALLERVTGHDYAAHIRKHIFQPAAMTRTRIDVYRPKDVSGMAHGYALVEGTLKDISDSVQIGNPSGGAYSTVVDMYRFSRALTRHRLLSPAFTETVITGKLDIPSHAPGLRYGYGFLEEKRNAIRFVGHNGGTPGYQCQMDIYPDLGHTVVVLTNQDKAVAPAIIRSQELLTQ
ncbi:serine hydrolase domain-containing protein [Streptomyces sp. NPDC087534]|uniref:serine hydrolase domain-containing protein n=2 Tax=unclassified Streptomyces TaxID=2593676 RepID=UPI00382EE51E